MDNGTDLVEGRTNISTKSNESILFSGRQRQPLGQPSTQDLVLRFEEADVSGQFFVGRFGDNEQKGGVDVAEAGY